MGYLLVRLWHLARLPNIATTVPARQPFSWNVQHCTKEHALDSPEALSKRVPRSLFVLSMNLAVSTGPTRDTRVQC